MIYENIYKKKEKLKLIQKKNVFVPNQTTKLILKSITKQLPRKRIDRKTTKRNVKKSLSYNGP